MLVADLLSWAKCLCGDVIWVPPGHTGPQRVQCCCGGLEARCDGTVVGSSDPSFTEAEMQTRLDEEYP